MKGLIVPILLAIQAAEVKGEFSAKIQGPTLSASKGDGKLTCSSEMTYKTPDDAPHTLDIVLRTEVEGTWETAD